MPGGPYDHPSFLVPQFFNVGRTTAGNAGTNVALQFSFPYAIRPRQLTALVGTVGTDTLSGYQLVSVSGTTTTTQGSLTTGTSTAASVGTSTLMAGTIPAGALCYIKNGGTDALAVASVGLVYTLDPGATWL
jgi:hypothetical protein